MPDWAEHVRARLSSLRLSPAREAEIVEELSQHLEDRWCELVAGGASPDEAARLTLADFRDRNVLAQYMAPLRQANRFPSPTPGDTEGRLLGDLWQDLRHATRMLWGRRGFAIAAVLTLALGIGCNAAIFTLINAVLLRPLALPDSDKLLAVYTRFLPSSGLDFPYFGLSAPEFADIRTRVTAITGIAGYNFINRNLTRGDGEPERVLTMRVTAEFFDVLGVRPLHGRTFTEQEGRPGENCLAILSYNASENAAGAIGSTVRLDDVPCSVIGVMPPGFGFRDDRVKVWTALPVNIADDRGSHGMFGVARLRDGSAGQLDAQLQSLRTYWSATYSAHHAKGHFAVSRPLQEDIVGDLRSPMLLLGGAVLFVLLIVCVNLAALLVSNGEARRREFAVRYALGGNRRRLVRQLIAEAMVFTCVGGLVGVVLAKWLLVGLLALYPQRFPMLQPVTIDYAAVLYTCALVVLVGFVVGFVPGLNATGLRVQESLRGDSRGATSARRAVAVRSVLVVSQLALSVILLVGATLLIRSWQRLQEVDLGFDPKHVLTFTITIPRASQEDTVARRTLEAIEDRLAATPGVESVGGISSIPLAGAGPLFAFKIEGRPAPSPGETPWNARYLTVMPNVFHTLHIPLKRGRLLDKNDVFGRPMIAVINETAARLYWPDEDPIGRTIRFNPPETNPSIQIVGVVGDVRSTGATQPAPPAIYLPLGQSRPGPAILGRYISFVVRTPGNPVNLAASARAAVASCAPGLPLADLRPMTEIVAAASGQPRFNALVMSFFAGFAFFLASLGLYGILSYNVEQRIREIGIRVALGAGRVEIFRLIVGNGVGLALMGVIIGIPVAFALTRLIKGVLPGVADTDPIAYVAVVVMLVTSAALASYMPARRGTKVDPIVALRTE